MRSFATLRATGKRLCLSASKRNAGAAAAADDRLAERGLKAIGDVRNAEGAFRVGPTRSAECGTGVRLAPQPIGCRHESLPVSGGNTKPGGSLLDQPDRKIAG